MKPKGLNCNDCGKVMRSGAKTLCPTCRIKRGVRIKRIFGKSIAKLIQPKKMREEVDFEVEKLREQDRKKKMEEEKYGN